MGRRIAKPATEIRWTEGVNPKPILDPAIRQMINEAVLTPPKVGTYGSATRYIIGLDLSLRAAAVCAIPFPWDGSLGGVRTRVFGHSLAHDASERQRMARLHEIADGIVEFCKEFPIHHAFVEQYAFSQAMSHARAIAEAGGVVKYRMYRKLGQVPEPVVASSARKLLLGKLPRKGVKKFVVAQVRRLEGRVREWGEDEIDAFVIANAGVERSGGVAMTFDAGS